MSSEETVPSTDALVHPEDARRGAERLAALLDGQVDHYVVEKRYRLPDGRPVRVREVVSRLDAGAAPGAPAPAVPGEVLEAVGRLAGGVAHDFNNMLTAIKGFSTLLQLEIDPASAGMEYLAEIQRATDRSAALTRQLLAFSRRQILRPEPFDLNETVRGMERMLRRLVGQDVRLVTELHPEPCPVLADPEQIEQVVVNLAVNSRDAMPRGGRLTLRTREVAGPDGERWVELEAADTGYGMDEATRERIFEPFFTTKEVGRGTGLGLSTVHGIVRQSGGTIEVESEPGVGTTFRVRLPRRSAAPDPAAGGPGGLSGGRGSETILLVEDEESVRMLAEQVLTRAGYRVLEAAGGEEALRWLERESAPPDLVLVDVVMPGMSGREVAERARARHPSVTVLFMSGYTEDAALRHGIGGRELPLLEKPWSAEALVARVREALGSRAVRGG